MERDELTQQVANLVAALQAIAQNGQVSNQPPATPPTEPNNNVSRLLDSLSSRIPKFSYDPEEDITFENWWSRYQDIVTKDGAALSEDHKTRLLLEKLDKKEYALYANNVLPKLPTEISFEESIKTLKLLFKSTTSVFRKRQDFLRIEYHGTGLEEYTGKVLRGFTSSEFKKMTQICIMIWIGGLKGESYQDIRLRALQLIESKPAITLLELEGEVKKLIDIKTDAKSLSAANTKSVDVNAIQKAKKKGENTAKADKSQKKPPSSPCFRCKGKHWSSDCEWKEAVCNYCKKIGHLEKCCITKKREAKQSPKVKSDMAEAAQSVGIHRIYKAVEINGKAIPTLFDTGADVTLLSPTHWKELGAPKLKKTSFQIKSANHQPIDVLGYFQCDFVLNGNVGSGPAYVADGYLTRNRMDQSGQNPLESPAGSTDSQCSCLFKCRKSGPFPGTIETGNSTKARPVPYAALPVVSAEIDRLTNTGVITPIEHAEWAAPVVAVSKKNGSIRLCGDFSTGLNDSIETNNHPLPTADEIFAKLNGGLYFTQIDLADAYLQCEVDEQAKQLLVINTHKGLFCYNRLPFGIEAAPGIFQQFMDKLINGLDGTSAYLDDLIVTGSTIEEHNSRVHKLMQKIQDFGFRIRMEKCSFLQHEIKYLGFIINKDGRKPDPEKIQHIKNMPKPENVSQLRSFLGLVQFYGTFINDFFNLRPPLDALTKKDADYTWTPECQKSFEQIKEILQSDLLLTHFDPKLPIIVSADASQYGIGCVIAHRFPDGTEKAIYHVSKALTKTQQNYSQIKKEGLGIVTAVTKFHRFLHGRHFTLRTDHKPLLAIFGGKQGVPVYSANRLQRWAITLLNYSFDIEYINTKDFGQADALSRLISEQGAAKEPEDQIIATIEVDMADSVTHNLQCRPARDTEMSTVWSLARFEKNTDQWILANRKDEMAGIQECLMIGERIVIPATLRNKVLKTLHRAHPGIVRMKQLARSYVYWPGLDNDIEKLVKGCDSCARASKDPIKNTLFSWPMAKSPWERVHADFAGGPIEGKYYLLIIDVYSKWPEIHAMSSITSTATLKIMRRIFAQFGNPAVLVTDNGSQFTSAQFKEFCVQHGISHIRSPPYHPQSNGQVERFVDSFKRTLIKLEGEGSTEVAVQKFLQAYRSTPCSASPNALTPAENFLGRKIRTVLDLLLPSCPDLTPQRNLKMERAFDLQNGARPREYDIQDKIYVKINSNQSTATWLPGIITGKIGYTIYEVSVNGGTVKKHTNQLRSRATPTPYPELVDWLTLEDNEVDRTPLTRSPAPAPQVNPPASLAPAVPLRRSARNPKPTVSFQLDPSKKSYHQK
ncbi:hypothetical protein CAEBREN_12555 [Caenorhabditis brenneri]|uniref:RNA-directed DNA polymerase n=1 Tax=Caenorhabditis brenneri TaxID=135651 RepID=G0P793_CAEBE|nr:hypothetical protein CAEBREN_12555 [Caenorhabditis brenneri]